MLFTSLRSRKRARWVRVRLPSRIPRASNPVENRKTARFHRPRILVDGGDREGEDRCQRGPIEPRLTNHRELFEVLLERRCLRLVQEVAVLVDVLRQVRRTWMPRGTRRRRRIIAVTQRAALRIHQISFWLFDVGDIAGYGCTE